ncbi:MAG: TetR/AcrR family transcriptional regulator [Sedimentisphaerales bacterium]|nr:TetR/AcrR family transcriptional regulator [Sedimentisphaerales bacterium]MBN2842437.1 TetR/AcrR family transcriptional regulator [Sedimentisphaerales bacterium]
MNKIVTEPNRTEKRSARTRRKLLEAALEVFSEYGVDATTIDDITRRADLGKGTFYRYFSDKREITTCLVEDSMARLISQLNKFSIEPKSIEDVLEHLLNVHYDFFVNNSGEFVLLFQGRLFLKLDRRISESMEGPFSEYLSAIESLLSPFVSVKMDLLRIRRLACAVAGFVFGYFSFAMVGMDDDNIQANLKPLRQSFVKSMSSFVVH